MSSSKDKGKAPQNPSDKDNLPPNSSSSQDQDDPSLFSRIAASANALSQNALAGAPTRNELHATARTALPNTSKASSSSSALSGSASGNSAWAESSRTQQTQSQEGHGREGGIREVSHTEAHIAQSEREFSSFLDGINSFTPSSPGMETAGVSENDGLKPIAGEKNIAFGEAWDRSQHAPSTPGKFLASQNEGTAIMNERTVQEQQMRDGEEVLAILSAPDRSLLEDSPVPSLEEETPNWGLSQDQISQIRGLMNEIFPPSSSQHAEISPENPLNLAPTFETPGSETQEDIMKAREHWCEQWEGVLTRYADEVWGDLLPLVKQARSEVEGMRDVEGSVTETPKALRRLGAILGHLRHNEKSGL